MQEISTLVWGEGEPVVFVHGSGDTEPAFVWSNQRSLGQHYQLLILTRSGYGQRPLISPRPTIEEDVQEILSVLEEKNDAHLVGFSYGGCIALVAAARQPDLVRSLTIIEPPAFSIARGNAEVEHKIEQTKFAYEPSQPLSPEEFLVLFMKSMTPNFPDTIEAVADVLKARLNAQHVLCAGKGHYIPDTGEQFNQILETFLRSVPLH